MSAYSGSFTGSFSGSYIGNGSQLTDINYYTLKNLPQTISTFTKNSITANSAFRDNVNINVKNRLNAETVISSSTQMSASMVLEGFGRADDAQPLLWSRIINLPNDIVSSSVQTVTNLIGTSISASNFSGSYYGDGSNLTGVGVPTGTVSSSTQTITNLIGSDLTVASITAEQYVISSSVTYMTTSFSSGSTIFGDDILDTHQFTGSITTSGDISVSGNIYGDGSNLTGIGVPVGTVSSSAQTMANLVGGTLVSDTTINLGTSSFALNGSGNVTLDIPKAATSKRIFVESGQDLLGLKSLMGIPNGIDGHLIQFLENTSSILASNAAQFLMGNLSDFGFPGAGTSALLSVGDLAGQLANGSVQLKSDTATGAVDLDINAKGFSSGESTINIIAEHAASGTSASIYNAIKDENGNSKILIIRSASWSTYSSDTGDGYTFPWHSGTSGQVLADDGTSNHNLVWSDSGGTHTDANNNVNVGTDALMNISSGTNNISIGVASLKLNATGIGNVVVGDGAGKGFLGDGAVFLGNSAGLSETVSNKLNIHNSDVGNPLIGGSFDTRIAVVNGLLSQESTGNSTYFGETAGSVDDFTDRQNVGIGNSALWSNDVGEINTAVGTYALLLNESGGSHTAIGYGALSSMEIDNRSTAVGSFAFSNVEAAYNGVAIGSNAGSTDATGADVVNADYSIFIGGSSKPKAEGNNNEIVIGAYAVGNGSNTATIGDTDVTELHLNKPGASIVMRSPNGTVFKLSVSDAGVLSIV